MPGGGKPVFAALVKLLRHHARMGERKEFHQTLEIVCFQSRDIPLLHGQNCRNYFPLGMFGKQALDFRKGERHLEGHRVFAPEHTVVVEDRDALGGRNEIGAALLRHFLDEGDDRLLRRSIVPRRKRILGGTWND